MHARDVILILITFSGVDVSKNVVPPEAGGAICRWGITGGSISAWRAIVAVEMVRQDVRVLEGLPSLCIVHNSFPQKPGSVGTELTRLALRDHQEGTAWEFAHAPSNTDEVVQQSYQVACMLLGRIGNRTERGNAETPKLKEELMVWAVAGRLLHTLVRNTEPAQHCASLKTFTDSCQVHFCTLVTPVHSGARRYYAQGWQASTKHTLLRTDHSSDVAIVVHSPSERYIWVYIRSIVSRSLRLRAQAGKNSIHSACAKRYATGGVFRKPSDDSTDRLLVGSLHPLSN